MFGNLKPMLDLIGELKKLPGIGPRSAEKMAFSILEMNQESVEKLSFFLLNIKKKIKKCSNCFGITDVDPCYICSDINRSKNLLCIVEEAKDIMVLEKNGYYKGLYHVLEGVLSPIDGIGPENLRIKELLDRINKQNFNEIIIALNPSVEGETTSLYLKKILEKFNIKITRIAHVIPIGGELQFTDNMTLLYAFEDRKEL